MNKIMTGYCSWCFKKGKHDLRDSHWYSKNEYICRNCGYFVVKCSVAGCNEMAKGRLTKDQVSELEKMAGKDGRKWLSKLRDNWKGEFCAQHNGTVPDFKMLNKSVKTLDLYPNLLKSKHINKEHFTPLTVKSTNLLPGVKRFKSPLVQNLLS